MLSIVTCLIFLLPKIDYGLESTWKQAIIDWYPYRPQVLEVRWNRSPQCNQEWGGGQFVYSTRTILICWPEEYDVSIIMDHEYGHALGLRHVPRYRRISIMNDGWMEPYGEKPTLEDLDAVRKLRDR